MIIYSPTFTGSVQITGSQLVTGDLTVQGNLTAQTFILSSSVSYFTESFASGSTRFGDSMDDTMKVTGSLLLTGSMFINTVTAQNAASNRGNLTINGATSILNLATGDTNAGYLYHGGTDLLLVNAKNGAMQFYTNDTERMRITSGSQVGIGTTFVDPTVSVDIQNASPLSNNVFLRLKNNNASEDCGIIISGSFGGAVEYKMGINTIVSSKDFTFSNSNTAGYRWYIDGSERMRISGSGDVGIGNTGYTSTRLTVTGKSDTSSDFSFVANNSSNSNLFLVRNDGNVGIGTNPTLKLQVYGNTQIDNGYLQINGLLTTYGNGTHTIQDSNPGDTGSRIGLRVISGTYGAVSDSTSKMIKFESGNNTEIGYIIRNGGTTISYVSSSDRRLKEDYKEFNAMDMINRIKIYDFKWKDSDYRGYGAIADELQEVIPSIVSGEKDAVYEDDKIHPQGVDYGKLTPVLLKAIQELKAEIDELKNK